MLPVVIGVVAVIAVGLYYYMTRLVFQVKVLNPRKLLTADEAEQHIGTIEVSLPDHYNPENRTDHEPFQRPDSYKLTRVDDSSIEVFPATKFITRGKILIELKACLKTTGTFQLTPVFGNNINVNFIDDTSIQFEVLPSRPCNVTLLKVERLDILDGKLEKQILYCGGMAQLFVQVSDRFGNIVKDELNAEVCSEFVTVLSSKFDDDCCSKCHVVNIRCLKEGKTTLKLKLGRRLKENVDVEIIPAPLDHSKCRVTPGDRVDTIAGDTVKVEVEFYDIYDKPFIFKEGFDKFSLKFHGLQRKEESLKIVSSCGHICKLEWTPTMAGLHNYELRIDGTILGNESFEINVNPRPLEYILVGESQSSLEDKNVFSCFTAEEKKLFIKGYDEFNNEVSVNAEQWCLRGENEDGIASDFDQSKVSTGNELQFSFSFSTEGTYNVNIQPIDGNSDIKVPDTFLVKVNPAPLDHDKCKIKQLEKKPIFQQSRVQLKLELELVDCMSKPFDSSKMQKESLDVKVGGEVVSPVNFLESPQGKTPNTVIIAVDVDTGDNACLVVNIEHLKTPVAEPITIAVTRVLPYYEMDYIHYANSMYLRIFHVSRRLLIGDDNANIDNINRVLKVRHVRPTDFVSVKEDYVQLNIEGTIENNDATFKLLSLIAESVHYQNQAYELDEKRGEWKGKSEFAYNSKHHDEAQACSQIKEKYSRLMDDARRMASNAILKFFNYNRTEKEIDLHGQLVADEVKLEKYANQLRKKLNETQAKRKVEQARDKMDEAINHLKERMVKQEEHQPDWLEIIVGAGHHSHEQRQKIRPKVEKFLEKKNIVFTECNKGSLLITYREYNGREPCYASFYCKKCHKCWESSSSWKNYWQKCFRCDRKHLDSKCYPLKLRAYSTSRQPANKSVQSKGPKFTRDNHRRLCQKCQELPDGQWCND